MLTSRETEVPPTKGAAIQTWMHEVSQRVSALQTHIISIAHPFLPEREFRNGVYYHRIRIGRVYRRLFQKITRWDPRGYHRRAFDIIRSIQPDIVHIHHDYHAAELVRWIRAELPAAKVILHMHNEVREFDHRQGHPRFPAVDALLGCSDYITDHYRPIIDTDRFQTIYNGVDLDRYRESARLHRQGLHPRAPAEGQFAVVYFGRVSPEKGTDTFVDLAHACRDDARLRFFCIGEISRNGKRARFFEDIEARMARDGINNLEFLDVVPQDKMHLAYALADVVVIPSRFEEPFCMVAIEAMAAEIPVVAVAKGGMTEYLRDGENALLIDDYDRFAELARERLLDLLAADDARGEMVRAARESVERRFDWFRIGADLERFYQTLLSS